MKILKLITSYVIGFIISTWVIMLWLLLINPYCDVTTKLMSFLPESSQKFLESDIGFVTLQIAFAITMFIAIISFYVSGYKEGKERYDITKNINDNINN